MVLALVLNTAGVLATDPMAFTYTGESHFSTASDILLNAAAFCVAGATLAGAVSLVRRLRRAEGEERLQLRWIAASATFMAAVLVLILTPGRPDRRGRVLPLSCRSCSSSPTRACRSAPASPSCGTGSTTST